MWLKPLFSSLSIRWLKPTAKVAAFSKLRLFGVGSTVERLNKKLRYSTLFGKSYSFFNAPIFWSKLIRLYGAWKSQV